VDAHRSGGQCPPDRHPLMAVSEVRRREHGLTWRRGLDVRAARIDENGAAVVFEADLAAL